MWPKIREYIVAHPEILGHPTALEDLQAMLFSRQGFRRAERNRLTWLIFRRGESTPLTAVRHYANPRWNDQLTSEYELCSQLWRALRNELVPQPLALVQFEQSLCFFERGVEGLPLSVELARRAALISDPAQLLPLVEEHVTLAHNCLNKLNALSTHASKTELETGVHAIYIRCRTFFEQVSADDTMLLDAGLAILSRCINSLEPRKRVIHRDFVPSNVLRGPDSFWLVDWEFHEESVLWFLEPLKFVYWYLVELARWVYRTEHWQLFETYLRREHSEPLFDCLDGFLEICGIPVRDQAMRRALWLLYLTGECELLLSVASDRSGFRDIFLEQFRRVVGHDWIERARSIHLMSHYAQTIEELRREVARGLEERAALEGRLAELETRFRWKRYQFADWAGTLIWRVHRTLQLNSAAKSKPFAINLKKLVYRSLPKPFRSRLLSAYEYVWQVSHRRFENSLSSQLLAIISNHNGTRDIVIFIPSVEWDLPLFQRPQQLAMAFARLGCLVFYCDPPYSKGRSVGFHQLANRLFLAKVPMKTFATILSPVAFTLTYNRDYLDELNNPRIVYEYIDELDVFPGSRSELEYNHQLLLERATLVTATAEALYEQVRHARTDVLLVPNAVDYTFFRQAIEAVSDPPLEIADLVQSGRPIVGYYGALAQWFDYDLIIYAARKRSNYSFVLIGPDYDGSVTGTDMSSLENIRLIPPRLYRELPAYLKYFWVCVIPFRLNHITHSTSPLKLFEYMAALKPVVTTAMRECRRYRGVLVADGPEDFVEKIDRGIILRNDREYLDILENVAKENTWDARAEVILNALEYRHKRGDSHVP